MRLTACAWRVQIYEINKGFEGDAARKVYEGLIRSTVVVAADGSVELAQYNVRAKGHVAKLRRDLGLED